jgi:hypothetical protein
MPYPSTYTDRAAVASSEIDRIDRTSSLDRPRHTSLVHMFEKTALAAAPFIAGALIATTLLSLAALLLGLTTLPAIIRSLGLDRHLGKYAKYVITPQQSPNATAWEQYSPLAATNKNGGSGLGSWAIPLLLANLGLAYFTLSGAAAKKPLNVVAVEKEVVAVPVPVVATPALGRQI